MYRRAYRNISRTNERLKHYSDSYQINWTYQWGKRIQDVRTLTD